MSMDKTLSTDEGNIITERQFLKVMCIDDDDAFDFRVLENVDKPVEEVSDFISSKLKIHKNAKWILLPCETV
ncbi:hypothetical protein FYJ38_12740 [Clostridium sp. WB02_MRS01]|uniref:hypothetical protein n=1 Tax=Clostridium sp. WB02_MRS01 TaxID=2605777 RepID=UPI0012B3C481|nr:hypothetical protein [Clostridium sp. WB02_MRS01]MSS09506.1 hypothetical protein [Clostridium sp. WB02_MRS01]